MSAKKKKKKKVSTVDIFEKSQRLLYGKNSKGIIMEMLTSAVQHWLRI